MPLIVTPGQYVKRAELYHQLNQLTAAGIGLIPALQQLERHPPSRSFRPALQKMLSEMKRGATFSEALRFAGGWTPALDAALLEAGERSGRLDACFKILADYYGERARMVRQFIGDLAYPAFVLHFAVFILPFPDLFLTGNLHLYLVRTLGVLLPIYIVLFLLQFASQARHGEKWRALIEMILHPIPVLGTARRWLAISRISIALESLLSAGVSIIEAWQIAGAASGSPALRRTIVQWRRRMLEGTTPAELVSDSKKFPDLFANQYATAEISGSLEETLTRMRRYYQEEGMRKMHTLAQWTPRFVYLAIALVIAYKIVSFYAGYFQNTQTILNGF